MPEPQVILDNLAAITNDWRFIAVFWHVCFALLILGLLAGARPSRRSIGIFLSLPLFSVGYLAWFTANVFNAAVFVVSGMVLLLLACTFRKGNIVVANPPLIIAGGLVLLFGWFYPHFQQTESWLVLLYAAPVGLIPCPSLAVVIGVSLLLEGLQSRAWSIVLAVLGIFYGLTGALYLAVTIDWLLLVAAILLLFTLRMNCSQSCRSG